MPRKEITVKEYEDALWSFMLEHCDITDGGSLFVKFHTSDRWDFERRVRARAKGYHRDDDRTGETLEQKRHRHRQRKKEYQYDKEERRRQYILDREERLRKLKWVKRRNRIRSFFHRLWPR